MPMASTRTCQYHIASGGDDYLTSMGMTDLQPANRPLNVKPSCSAITTDISTPAISGSIAIRPRSPLSMRLRS
jgi:hypothetical protein